MTQGRPAKASAAQNGGEAAAKPLRVAVVGSGLSGLAAAYGLAKVRLPNQCPAFEVHVFERNSAIGLDAAAVEVPLAVHQNGGVKVRKWTWQLDTPMRAIQGGYYTRVLQLYKHLRLGLHRTDFSYSFFQPSAPPSGYAGNFGARPHQEAVFLYEGSNGLALKPLGIPTAFKSSLGAGVAYGWLCLASLAAYLYLIVLAFLSYSARQAPVVCSYPLLAARVFGKALGLGNEFETVDDWCKKWRIGAHFRASILEPLFCCVCTCSRADLARYPVVEILDYVWLTFGARHYVLEDGCQSAVQALTQPLCQPNIHLGLAGDIRWLRVSDSLAGRRALTIVTGDGVTHDFHRVILATEATQAKLLLQNLLAVTTKPRPGLINSAAEAARIRALGKFIYTKSLVVNHCEASTVLPTHEADWRDLNIALPPPSPSTGLNSEGAATTVSHHKVLPNDEYIMATHIISRTHPTVPFLISTGPLLQTTNPTTLIEEHHVLSSTWFDRALVTPSSKEALQVGFLFSCCRPGNRDRSPRFQGLNGVYLCGSWCAPGIPLLEGCVVSAGGVIRALAAEVGIQDYTVAWEAES